MGNTVQKIASLLIISCIIFSCSLQAQTTFGLKGGVNFPSWKVSLNGVDINTSSSTTYMIGSFLNYPLSDNVSIKPELLYQVMGSKYDTSSIVQNYIAVPVLFKFDITDLLFVEAGPQLGILLGASAKSDTTVKKSDFKSTDFQFIFGGGIKLTQNIHSGFRYGYGLSNILSSNNTSLFQGEGMNATLKNNSLSVFLSYAF